MELRPLGRTGLQVSALGFGCGAIGGLMVRGDRAEQDRTVGRAIDAGVTYFDTAPLYGNGQSEANLGRALRDLGAWNRVVVGTKVRLVPDDVTDPVAAVRRSLENSLRLLGRDSIDLLQLHNPIGAGDGGPAGGADALPLALVLGPISEGLVRVREDGLTRHIGFTGLGDTGALRAAALQHPFEAVQAYFNPLNPSAGYPFVTGGGQDFEGLIDTAGRAGLGVIAIRIFAAGALTATPERVAIAGNPARPLTSGGEYERDLERAKAYESLAAELGLENPLELGLRFVLAKGNVSTALLGCSTYEHLVQALHWTERGPLPPDAVERVLTLAGSTAG